MPTGRRDQPLFGTAWAVLAVLVLPAWQSKEAAAAETTAPAAQATLPSADVADTEDSTWDVPARPLASSRWIDAQKARATAALKDHRYDVLVVPLQAGRDAPDHRARSMMTFGLAQAIATRSDLRVADPVLVAKAFGLNARQIPAAEIDALAVRLGVSRILIGTVAKDGNGRFAVRMLTVTLAKPGDLQSEKTEQVRTYAGNAFSDTSPPVTGFRAIRDTILNDSGIRLRAPPIKTSVRMQPALPNSVDEVLAPETAEDAVHLLQLMGVLVPPDMSSRTRDQLFERSLALLEQVNPESDNYDLLVARAFLYLGRRPAAVAILDKKTNTLERALLAYANGNLDALTREVDKTRPGLLATIAEIEKERLRLHYGASSDPALVKQLVEQEPLWGPLLARAVIENDTWRVHTHVPLKLALDAMYPEKSFALETYVAGRVAVGEVPEEYDVAALLLEHLVHIEKNNAGAESADRQGSLNLRMEDITDIYRELLVADVHAQSWHLAARIGKPRSSLGLLERYEPLIADHPALVSSKMEAYRYLGNDAIGTEQQNVQNRVNALARRTIELNGALTPDTVHYALSARWLYPEQKLATQEEYDRLLFRSDWPQPPDSSPMLGSVEKRQEKYRHCLAYTMTNLDCLVNLHDLYLSGPNLSDKDGARLLLSENAARFVGHPERIEFMAKALRRTDGVEAANRVLLDAIEAGTTQWAPYEKIGLAHANASRFAEALDTVLRYPGFHGLELESAVVQSNRAYEFGSVLYWAGAHEEAKPLYELAAATRTGSAAEMASAQRLALLDGDYEAAQYHASRRIRRYQEKYAVRDLIGLSVIAGNPEQAWSIVNGFQAMFDQPEPWVGALIAHRADNRDVDDIVEWGYEDGRDLPGSEPGVLSARFAFLAHTLDRAPSAALADVLRARKPGLPRTMMPDMLLMIDDERPYFEVRHRSQLGWSADGKLENLLIYAADALVALHEKNYRAAFARLDDATRHYDLREFLPAYAWAAAKSGETTRLEGYLAGATNFKSRLPEQNSTRSKPFYENIAEAMLLGAKGQADPAIERLKAANALIVHNEDRYVLTRYQIMESARLLYEDTGNAAYRDFALDLARRNAVIEPIQAYTHSFVAMLSTDRRERIVSLARVLVLDPQSRCIDRAAPEELDEARRLAAKGYPLPGTGTQADI